MYIVFIYRHPHEWQNAATVVSSASRPLFNTSFDNYSTSSANSSVSLSKVQAIRSFAQFDSRIPARFIIEKF